MTFLFQINICPVQGFIFLFLMAGCKNELVELKWLIARDSYYPDKLSAIMCSDSNADFWIRIDWISFFKILCSSVRQGTVTFLADRSSSVCPEYHCEYLRLIHTEQKCQQTICSFIFLTKSKCGIIPIYNHSQLKSVHSEIFYMSSLQVFFSHLSLSPIYYGREYE